MIIKREIKGEMLLCLLPLTMTLAALTATVGVDASAAPMDKRFALRPVDPLTRRSAMDKNFMRFGRAFDCSWSRPVPIKRRDSSGGVGRRVDSNFIRFGRRDSNFIRFGRGEVYTPGDNKIPRRNYDVDVDGLEVRFGRSIAAATDRSPFAAVQPYDRR